MKKSKKNVPLKSIKKWGKYLRLESRFNLNVGLRTDGLRQFFARYVLAKGFKGLKITDISPRTLRGYDAMFKVQIAYSAFDALLEGVALFSHRSDLEYKRFKHKIINPELANSIRANNENLILVSISHANSTFARQLESVYSARSDNVMHIASAIRHLSAHGLLTVNGARLDLAKNVKDLNILADLVIKYTDDLFTEFVEVAYDSICAEFGYDGI